MIEAEVEVEKAVEVGIEADTEFVTVADTEADTQIVEIVVVVAVVDTESVAVEAAVPSPHMVCHIFGKTDPRLSIAFRNAYSTSWLMVIMR